MNKNVADVDDKYTSKNDILKDYKCQLQGRQIQNFF